MSDHERSESITKKSIELEKQIKDDFLVYNLGYAMRPLTFLQIIFGVRRSLGSETILKKACCISALVVMLLSAAVVLRERKHLVYPNKTAQLIATDVLSLLALVCTNMCNVFVSTFHAKYKYLKYFKNNEKILKCLKYSPERYRNGRRVVLSLLGIVLLPLFLVCSYDFYAEVKCFNVKYASLYLIDYLFIFMNSLVSLEFVCSLALQRSLFLIINIKIQAYYDKKYENIETKKATEYYEKSVIQNLLFQLDKFAEDALQSFRTRTCTIEELTEAYIVLCDQSTLSNKFFTEQNFLMTINGILSLLRSLYFATSSSLKVHSHAHNFLLSLIMATCLFALFDTMILFGITACCEMIKGEAKRTSVILDYILSKLPKDDLEEIYLWAELASRRSPNFTACNCFNIDFSLMFNIAATVATYLIVLTQFS